MICWNPAINSMVQDILWKVDSSLYQRIVSLWNLKVHYHVHESLSLDSILSHVNPVCLIDSHLPKVHFNVNLSPTPKSSSGLHLGLLTITL